jgi:hypothetical protein
MLSLVQRLFCRHSWYWSERRQLEVCYDCGHSRRARESVQTPVQATGFEAFSHAPQDAEDEDDLFQFQCSLHQVCEEQSGVDHGVRMEWDFGTLQDQCLSQAKVVSTRQTD